MNLLTRVFLQFDEWEEDFSCYIKLCIPRRKSDKEQLKSVLQNLTSTKRKLNIQNPSKSTTKAREYIEEGEKKLQVQLWPDAVEIFTKAIMHAEIDSYELVLGYTKRSIALCKCGMHRNALSDMERALETNCSHNELGSLFATQMEYLKVIENEIRQENAEALSKPPQINSQTLGTWDTIRFQYNPVFGRYGVARRQLQAGEILSTYRIYATVIHFRFRHKYCWNCCKQTWTGIACHQCVNVIYCDKNCRDMAWQEHHDIECPVICAISGPELYSHDLLALRLTVKAFKEAGTLENLQGKIHEIDQIRDRVLKCNTHGLFDPTKYASVYSLLRNTNHFYISAVRAFAILCSLAATTNILGEKIKHLKTLSKNKYATFIGGLIKRNFEICLANSTKLTLDDDIGLVLDPCWSMFLHSDNPSVTNFSSGGTSTLIAIEDIRKGDKILLRSDPGFVYNIYGKRKDRVNYSEFSKIVEGS